VAEALAHMDDAVTTLSASSSGFPAPASVPDESDDPLPTIPARGRFARGTSERTISEVRAMLAASIAAVPAPQIVIIAPRRALSRNG
jgi:hypothetical protein